MTLKKLGYLLVACISFSLISCSNDDSIVERNETHPETSSEIIRLDDSQIGVDKRKTMNSEGEMLKAARLTSHAYSNLNSFRENIRNPAVDKESLSALDEILNFNPDPAESKQEEFNSYAEYFSKHLIDYISLFDYIDMAEMSNENKYSLYLILHKTLLASESDSASKKLKMYSTYIASPEVSSDSIGDGSGYVTYPEVMKFAQSLVEPQMIDTVFPLAHAHLVLNEDRWKIDGSKFKDLNIHSVIETQNQLTRMGSKERNSVIRDEPSAPVENNENEQNLNAQ